MKLLVLAGTAEARGFAAAAVTAGHDVTVSLAGLTARPASLAGRQRVGGFGGAQGLAALLEAEGFHALVDATHPFAARISAHAVRAAEQTGRALLRLERPGWPPEPGWLRVPDLAAAAAALPVRARVFLSTGAQSLAAFAGRADCWFLARGAEDGPFPLAQGLRVTGRPPFTAAAERRLMEAHRIGLLVSRNSGGAREKLDAAAALGVTVVMVDRPPPPAPAAGRARVETVAEALGWLAAQSAK
ncbi:cobalt-precorrin-6A reductase [Paroceanicella profunda]|uniref:Cobalt-precorrin-6A reductase n=1 Tax=Paroceanicella profunda TaxID=2579971 RepID=A0A5B8FFV9_9RHOB|nr:cobalt-precorrin-6A reductase [Paroceanicella profunda]QDL90441.1 cobalt-precorrin-6A reductase [Paroceanicella profunda]